MPSQRRTNNSNKAGRKRNDFREHDHPDRGQREHDHVDREHDRAVREQRVDDHAPEHVDGKPQRWRRVGVPVPPVSVISTVSTVSGGSGLTIAIITGQVQPCVVWPTVTLVIAGMAYDVACRALHRGRRA